MHRSLIVGALLSALLAGCLTSAENPRYEAGVDDVATNSLPLVDHVMFNGDIRGTGVAAAIPYCKAEPYTDWRQCIGAEWKVHDFNTGTHGAAKSSAILYNGTIFVGSDRGVLHALAPNGAELWQTALEPSKNGIHGTPVAADGRVFIGGYDGAMYAFDAATGERLWRTQVGSWIGSSARIHDGRLYVSVEHGGSTQIGGQATTSAWGDVQILDLDGNVLWRSEPLGSHPHSSVAISPKDDVFVVGCNDDHVYAWDLDERRLRWTFHADQGAEGDVKGPILIHDGAAFFGSWDHHFYAVELEDGSERWRIPGRAWFMTGAAVDADRGVVYFGGHDGRVIAADVRTGDVVWQQQTGARVVGSPTLAGEVLLFGSNDMNLYAFDKQDGTKLWAYPAKGRISAAPLVVGDRIVFADRSECGPLKDGHCSWQGTHGILYSLGPM